MFKFGARSLDNMAGVHPLLVDCAYAVLKTGIMDFSVIDGIRTVEQQREMVRRGVSQTLESKHLIQPDGYGHAIDLAPFPIDWKKVHSGFWPEIARFGVLAGLMKREAKLLGATVIWGVDWDNDGQTIDHTFFDAPHFELRLK